MTDKHRIFIEQQEALKRELFRIQNELEDMRARFQMDWNKILKGATEYDRSGDDSEDEGEL